HCPDAFRRISIRVSKILRHIARSCAITASHALGASWLTRRAALAPVELKTPTFERVVSAVAKRGVLGSALVETNGGSNNLRLLLPPGKPALLFGRACRGSVRRGRRVGARAVPCGLCQVPSDHAWPVLARRRPRRPARRSRRRCSMS